MSTDQDQKQAHLDGLIQLLAQTAQDLVDAQQALDDAEREVEPLRQQIEDRLGVPKLRVTQLDEQYSTLRSEAIQAALDNGLTHDALISKTYTDFDLPPQHELRAWLIAEMPGMLSPPSDALWKIMRRSIHDSKRLSKQFPTAPGVPVERDTFDLKRDLTPWLPERTIDEAPTADAEAEAIQERTAQHR